MGGEDWNNFDFAGIVARRPEGGGDCDPWEKPFSFTCALGGAAHGDHLEPELYFDVDNALPFRWESMSKEQTNKSSDAKEFEFNMSFAEVEPVQPSAISPADELFFKGKLLPLHLPPRLQMVRKLSSEKQQEKRREQAPSVKVPCLFQSKYSKFCTNTADVAPLSTSNCILLPGSTTLHTRSSSWWDPRDRDFSTDRDSSGDSSSSRDSSGSSQDACFDSSKEFQTTSSESKGFVHNREVFSTHGSQPERSSLLSSWLKPPFKWRVLFGAKKVTKTTADIEKAEQRQPLGQPYDDDSAVTPSMKCFPVPDRYFSDCSGELSWSGDVDMSGELDRGIAASYDRERDQGGISKARDYLQKYMKILKPPHGKKFEQPQLQEQVRRADFSAAAVATNLPSAAFAFVKRPLRHTVPGNRSFSSFSQSSRIAMDTVATRRCPPTHTNIRAVSSSSMSELQSAIQGAIAHCKQSQGGKQESNSTEVKNVVFSF